MSRTSRQAPVAEVPSQRFAGRISLGLGQAQRPQQRASDLVFRFDGEERLHHDAVREVCFVLRDCLLGEPCLADAADANNRQQSALWIRQKFADLV